MATTNNEIVTKVTLDTDQAQASIVKLNAKASDSTKTLEERLEAKNKQSKIQNDLSKKTISTVEKEVASVKKLGGSEKDVAKVEAKLQKERLKALKTSTTTQKQLNKLNQTLDKQKAKTKAVAEATAKSEKASKGMRGSINGMDDAMGGLLTRMKLLLANPIGILISALVGLFMLFKEAVGRSGKATESFSKIGAKLSAVFNTLMQLIMPLVEWIGEKLVKAFDDPVQSIKDLGSAIVDNVINRFKALMVLGDAIGALFRGDFKEASKLATDGFIQLGTGVTNATDKLEKLVDETKKVYNEQEKLAQLTAQSERKQAIAEIEFQKLQLTSQNLAEKQRQIRDDTSKSIDERIEANKELSKVLDDQLKREMKLASDELKRAEAEFKSTGESIDNIKLVGDAEIKLLEIQERITSQRSEQLVNETSLIKEKTDLLGFQTLAELDAHNVIQEAKKVAKEKEDEDKKVAKEKKKEEAEREIEAQFVLDEMDIERKRAHGENVLQLELALLKKKKDNALLNDKLTAKERLVIQGEYSDTVAEMSKELNKTQKQLDKEAGKATVDALASTFGFEKEVAVARMLLKAPEAIADIFKTGALKPTIIQRVGHIVSGLATVVPPIIKGLNDIKKVRFSGSKGGGGSSGGGGSATAPTGISSSAVEDIEANNMARLGVDPSLGQNAGAIASNNVQGESSSSIVFSENSHSAFKRQVQFKEEKITI